MKCPVCLVEVEKIIYEGRSEQMCLIDSNAKIIWYGEIERPVDDLVVKCGNCKQVLKDIFVDCEDTENSLCLLKVKGDANGWDKVKRGIKTIVLPIMVIPECCCDCNLSSICGIKSTCIETCSGHISSSGRPKDCPLVEIPSREKAIKDS